MNGDSENRSAEFSRPVRLDRVDSEGTAMEIEATATEREDLAQRFGLVAIERLRASVELKWLRNRSRLRLQARLDTHVVQSCVVSLEPVEESIDQEVEIFFEPAPVGAPEREVVLEVSDDAEPLSGDSLDVGEIVAEELALALNPYPRKEGLEQGPSNAAGPGETGLPSPFEVLSRIKRDE